MNSTFTKGSLNKVDLHIRRIFNDLVGGPPLSKNLFYTNWKYGGLDIKSLRERYLASKINTISHFLLRNDDTRLFMNWQIKEEAIFRQVIRTQEHNYFFDWKLPQKSKLKGGFHSFISEGFAAANELMIGISYNDDINKMLIWASQENSTKELGEGDVLKHINHILEKRHFNFLCDQKIRGQSFSTFKNSRCSNFYIGNCKASTSDALLRFSLRARNDTIWTPARKAVIWKNQEAFCNCNNHRFCNLLHVLNNCDYNFERMTLRHNMAQNKVVEAVMKHRKLKDSDIKKNSQVNLTKFDETKNISLGIYQRLRQDLWFLVKLEDDASGTVTWRLYLVEFAIPFG
jgi:hypothetical protein